MENQRSSAITTAIYTGNNILMATNEVIIEPQNKQKKKGIFLRNLQYFYDDQQK